MMFGFFVLYKDTLYVLGLDHMQFGKCGLTQCTNLELSKHFLLLKFTDNWKALNYWKQKWQNVNFHNSMIFGKCKISDSI